MTTENKSICPYPFEHSYIGSRYERKLCCISKDIEELRKTTNEEFWNSDKLKTVRKDMLEGKPIAECEGCYKFEELGLSSLRTEMIENYTRFKKASVEEQLQSITNPDGSVKTNPATFDYRTIHCNLQCISCGYVYSSTHMNLYEKMWNKKVPFVIDYEYENNMAEELISSIINKECRTIYWAGGEPMSSHVHWKVMDKISELLEDDQYKDYVERIYIHYNTNMTKLNWKNKPIPELLERIQPTIQASIDGTHETFEYCRDGASWNEVSKNWDEYFKLLNKENQFGIASVLSAPVIFDIDRWFDFFEKYNPHLYNHKLYVQTETRFVNGRCIGDNFLDIRLFPDNISYPAIDHAISRFENSKLRGKEKTISILNSYKSEREMKKELFSDDFLLQNVKKQTVNRDRFLVNSKSYGNLLSIINPNAYQWYMEI